MSEKVCEFSYILPTLRPTQQSHSLKSVKRAWDEGRKNFSSEKTQICFSVRIMLSCWWCAFTLYEEKGEHNTTHNLVEFMERKKCEREKFAPLVVCDVKWNNLWAAQLSNKWVAGRWWWWLEHRISERFVKWLRKLKKYIRCKQDEKKSPLIVIEDEIWENLTQLERRTKKTTTGDSDTTSRRWFKTS